MKLDVILKKNLSFQVHIEQISQEGLEEKFKLYKSLASKGVRDELYTELLAQELDKRE
jgi:hypothetical protein